MYIWYDGPQLYRYRTGQEIDYLVSSIEEIKKEGTENNPIFKMVWMLSPCKLETLNDLELNKVDLHTASRGDTGYLYILIVEYTRNSKNEDWNCGYNVWKVKSEEMPSDYFVKKGVTLNGEALDKL